MNKRVSLILQNWDPEILAQEFSAPSVQHGIFTTRITSTKIVQRKQKEKPTENTEPIKYM